MRYRRKPVGEYGTVDAMRFTRNNFKKVRRFTDDAATFFKSKHTPTTQVSCTIWMPEYKAVSAVEGDIIAKDTNGRFYTYSPNRFKEIFEPLEGMNRYAVD